MCSQVKEYLALGSSIELSCLERERRLVLILFTLAFLVNQWHVGQKAVNLIRPASMKTATYEGIPLFSPCLFQEVEIPGPQLSVQREKRLLNMSHYLVHSLRPQRLH